MTPVINSSKKQIHPKFIMKHKKTLSTVFSVALFFACSGFVAYRGYSCFKKYLSVPESVDISFKFSGAQKFPEITFCTKPAFNKVVFDECQLNQTIYLSDENPAWVNYITSTIALQIILLEEGLG